MEIRTHEYSDWPMVLNISARDGIRALLQFEKAVPSFQSVGCGHIKKKIRIGKIGGLLNGEMFWLEARPLSSCGPQNAGMAGSRGKYLILDRASRHGVGKLLMHQLNCLKVKGQEFGTLRSDIFPK